MNLPCLSIFLTPVEVQPTGSMNLMYFIKYFNWLTNLSFKLRNLKVVADAAAGQDFLENWAGVE